MIGSDCGRKHCHLEVTKGAGMMKSKTRAVETAPKLREDSGGEESLGQYIRRMRKARGLTQEELAQVVGITKAYICIIERGELTGRGVSVSPVKLDAIAHALGIPAEEIFNRARILPRGTVLVRDDVPAADGLSDGAGGYAGGLRDLEYMRDWDELRAAGYADLPPAVREEIKRYIEFRARQVKDSGSTR